MELDALSDDALLAKLAALAAERHRINAAILAYLIEVDDRRLHLQLAIPSLFAFCRAKLGMSEGEAYRRMRAARLVRRFPALLEALAAGRTHLSNLLLLEPVLTSDNIAELIDAVAGKSKRQVQELVASLAPRQLPADLSECAHVLPIAPGRYEVRFIAGTAVAEKLARAQELLRHRIPNGDLAAVVEASLDALIDKIERRKFGKTERPQSEPRPSAQHHHITQATRRQVIARDGEQCSFIGKDGTRCPERGFLEFDHHHARALGGSGEASNIRTRCRQHNHFDAEQVFGRDHVEAARSRAKAKRAAALAGPQEERETRETITKALVFGLHFARDEARRAVAALDPDGWGRPHTDLLRAALAILT